jgi:hypothetical protein
MQKEEQINNTDCIQFLTVDCESAATTIYMISTHNKI